MTVYIKNNSGLANTYRGKYFDVGEYKLLSALEKSLWADDSTIIANISNTILIVSKTSNSSGDISNISDAIDYIKSNEVKNVNAQTYPFSAKVLSDGKKLYKRIHGISETVGNGATVNIDFTVPHPHCKFTGAEIMNTDIGDTLSYYILDDANNTYSGAPGSYYQLNQFGFDVQMPQTYYSNTSDYDADLYYGMIVRCEYTNNTGATKTISSNLWLHEVKD